MEKSRSRSPSKSRSRSKSSSRSPRLSPNKYLDIVGPKDQPDKYALVEELGKGKYGTTYKAKNLIRIKGEEKYYAVKVLHPPKGNDTKSIKKVETNWLKEVNCLKDILPICDKVGLLCYKDSFVVDTKGKLEFVIVIPLLEGYITLSDYLDNYDHYDLTQALEEAKDIYKTVVDIKNSLTDLCINHSDLHTENIMIHPKTKDIKVIDMGKCQTPQQEIEEWKNSIDDWNDYSDEARLRQLRKSLADAIGFEQDDDLNRNDFYDELINYAVVKQAKPGCKRPSEDLIQREKELFDETRKFLNQMFSLISKQEKLNSFERYIEYVLQNKDVINQQGNLRLKNAILQKIDEFSDFDDKFKRYINLLQ
jgi:hypothetical protein